MVKILEVPKKDDAFKVLYRNFVTYNNSQNSINEKTFNAINETFKRLKLEFEDKGLLVCIKQSDKYQYIKTRIPSKLLDRNKNFMLKFSLHDFNKTKDFIVDLEKLLQIFLAFTTNPQNAIQNKPKLLNSNSEQNKVVIDFIKNPAITYNDLVNLYLLYLRSEYDKKGGRDKKNPNSLYLIYCFSRYECKNDGSKISLLLDSSEKINAIIKKYTFVLTKYYKSWVGSNEGKEYNDMIKSTVDTELLDKIKSDSEDYMEIFGNAFSGI